MNNNKETLSADTPFGIAAEIVINKHFNQMMQNLEGTIDGSDIEALHDMRVASRRLRADFRVFKKCLPIGDYNITLPKIRAITQALGSVRDHDVFLEYLVKMNKKNKINISQLIDIENAKRESSRIELLRVLDDLSTGNIGNNLYILTKNTKMRSLYPENHFAGQANKLIRSGLIALLNISFAINDPDLITEIHLMRINTKKLRYVSEAFIPCFDDQLAGLISEIKLLQEQLGLIHDCDVWIDRLKSYNCESNLSDRQGKTTDFLISERREKRNEAYTQALSNWNKMLDSQFPERLLETIKYSIHKIKRRIK